MKIATYLLLALGAIPLIRYVTAFHGMTDMLSKLRHFDGGSLARVCGFLAALAVLAYPLVYLGSFVITLWQRNAGNRDLALASSALPIVYIIAVILLVIVYVQSAEGGM